MIWNNQHELFIFFVNKYVFAHTHISLPYTLKLHTNSDVLKAKNTLNSHDEIPFPFKEKLIGLERYGGSQVAEKKSWMWTCNSLLSVTSDSVVLLIYICKHHMNDVWSGHIGDSSILRLHCILYPVQTFASIMTVNSCSIMVLVKKKKKKLVWWFDSSVFLIWQVQNIGK